MSGDGAFPTSSDHFFDGRLIIRQPVDGYRAGSDPLFLAAAVSARAGETVLDLGCGVGTAALSLLARIPDVTATGLDIQEDLVGLANDNALANSMADRFQAISGSLTAPPKAVPNHHYHHVMTNPPWYEPGTINPPSAVSKAIGHLEEVDLAQWLKLAVRFLRPKGRLYVVHRADRLGGILAGLDPLAVGEIKVFPLWPKAGRAASRVLVTARKDVRTPLEIVPGLVLHDLDGGYTVHADDILRRMAPLF